MRTGGSLKSQSQGNLRGSFKAKNNKNAVKPPDPSDKATLNFYKNLEFEKESEKKSGFRKGYSVGKKTQINGENGQKMSKVKRNQQERKQFQQTLMYISTLNEPGLLSEMVNKSETALKKELRKARVPTRKARNLVKLLSQNRDNKKILKEGEEEIECCGH